MQSQCKTTQIWHQLYTNEFIVHGLQCNTNMLQHQYDDLKFVLDVGSMQLSTYNIDIMQNTQFWCQNKKEATLSMVFWKICYATLKYWGVKKTHVITKIIPARVHIKNKKSGHTCWDATNDAPKYTMCEVVHKLFWKKLHYRMMMEIML